MSPQSVLVSPRRAGILAAGLLLPVAPAPEAAAQAAPPRSEVFVVATLYGRHATTPAYGHDTLRAIIERIRPEVVVLDVSPRELQAQSVHPSKREYPEVIFPLVRDRRYRAYAGEPDEPEFSRIVQALGAALERFQRDHAESAAADRAYEEATWQALAQLWRTPADVNGGLTDRMLSARRQYQDRLACAEVAEAWRLWNQHAVAVVRRAYRENPGARILVLIGVDNCAELRSALRELPELRLIDTEQWLRREA